MVEERKIAQQWTGEITDIDGEMIHAIMHDLTSPSMPDEEWMFSSINISEGQKHLIIPGITFTFDILTGSIWDIKLIDNGKWTQEEVDKIEAKAIELKKQFDLPTTTP